MIRSLIFLPAHHGLNLEEVRKIFYPLFISYLPLIAIFSEFMQLVHDIPGTIDVMDLLSYGISIALFILAKKL